MVHGDSSASKRRPSRLRGSFEALNVTVRGMIGRGSKLGKGNTDRRSKKSRLLRRRAMDASDVTDYDGRSRWVGRINRGSSETHSC